MLKGKHIILGVTGSIAAYKAATLTRLLVKEGANVKVVMTPLAKEFITPLTMATLSKSPIMVDFYNPENGDWNSHVDLGLWADLYLIAPASANTIGKMAGGIADNLLLTTYLSAKCPVMVAPAMDLDMYKHPATQRNLKVLQSFGNIIIEPESGELASGLIGKGRMEEPERIVAFIADYFARQEDFKGKKVRYLAEKVRDFKGKKVVVTAGPTYEKIDPVRFIGNYSSGKMGLAIAEEFAGRGAEVVLVCGPVNLKTSHPAIRRVDVESAAQMYEVTSKEFVNSDVAVLSAAVADFTPKEKADHKIKRGKDDLLLELLPTKDIAAELGRIKTASQLLVGFALETNDEEVNALSKMQRKNLDMIVLNSLNDKGAGFSVDTNKVTILDKAGNKTVYELKTKVEVAKDIVDQIASRL